MSSAESQPSPTEAELDSLPKKPSRRRRAEAETLPGPKRGKRKRSRLARRHPDIEIARLMVKRGYVEKGAAVEALKVQKARAKAGKGRVPFLRLLVKRRALEAARLADAQDEIRRHTYLCDTCNARAVVLAGSQSRAGACPRCGAPIAVAPPTGDDAMPVREFTRQQEDTDGLSKTEDVTSWRPLGSRWRRGLRLNEVAFERYLVEAELGRGAMGVVYRATHMQLDKQLALKVLFPDEDAWEHQVARFRREAAAVQKLKHPNIVAVHDFGGDGETYYLTMDLVEGGDSLHTALKDFESPRGLRWRIETLVEVARAAAHAHEAGIIHRDLKPANVLLDPEKGAQVADFGLAKDEAADAGELTRTHDRLGTPLFMAPEQIRRGASTVDKRADVWALGVMLFVCVTGRYPFRSRTVMDLYLRILREQPDWYGNKFSAPERKGFRQPTAPAATADAEGAESVVPKSVEIDSSSESDTEITTRDHDGQIPETRDAPADATPAPPPFAPPPELEGNKVPDELRAIITCALAKDPDDRYPTADAFADDLESFLAGRKVSGGGPTFLKRLRMQLWRRRVLRPLALGLGLLVVAVAAFGGLAYQRREAELRLDADVEAAWARAGSADEEGHRLAQDALSKLLTAQPEHPRALLRRAQARLRLLELEPAREDLERALSLAQGAAQDPEWVVLSARASQARLELLAGDPLTAVRMARNALEDLDRVPAGRKRFDLQKDLSELLTLSAFAADAEDAMRLAESSLEQVCADPRATALSHALHGRLALYRNDLAAAQTRLDASAADASVEHLETQLLRGALLLAKGEKASFAFSRARRAYPAQGSVDVQLLGEMARALYQDDKWQENLRVNAASVRLTPWCGIVHYYCGNVYLHRLVETEQALDAFRRASLLDPFDEVSRDYYLALLLARRDQPKRLEEAAGAIRREELELRPNSTEPPLRLAYVLIRQGKLLQAWEALDRADSHMSRSARKHGVRSGLARSAILRTAGADELNALDRLGTWRDITADDWEREYHAGWAEATVSDGLEVARIYLEAGQPQEALDLLDEIARERLAKVPRRKAERMEGAILTLKAWALAALGKPAPAKGKLGAAMAADSLAPQATPDALRSVPEFRALLADDPEFRESVEGLAARRRDGS